MESVIGLYPKEVATYAPTKRGLKDVEGLGDKEDWE